MIAIKKGLHVSLKKVAKEDYSFTQIIDGHKISYTLNKSELRQLIETLDNEI